MFDVKNRSKRRGLSITVLIIGAVIAAFIVFRTSSSGYEDGTYRGTFADTDAIQIAVEITLSDGIVTDARFRHLRRDDKFYLGTEEEPYASVVSQYQEALAYLVGRKLDESLERLYSPEEIVRTGVDGYSAATIRSAKIISAVRDALNRGVYRY